MLKQLVVQKCIQWYQGEIGETFFLVCHTHTHKSGRIRAEFVVVMRQCQNVEKD